LVREDVAEQPAVRGVAVSTVGEIWCFCRDAALQSATKASRSVCHTSRFLFPTHQFALPPLWF